MMQASVEVVLADSQRQQFLSVLKPLLEPTRWEAGCVRCQLWRNVSDPRRLRFLTEWQSGSALDRYLESGRFREVLVAAELSDEEPVIRIHTISETRDLEYVAELVGGGGGAAVAGRNSARKGAAESGRRS